MHVVTICNNIINIMLLFQKVHPFQDGKMFMVTWLDIDSSGVDAGMSKDICQFCDIFIMIIETSGIQMTQVARKYFGWTDVCIYTQCFQISPDIASG